MKEFGIFLLFVVGLLLGGIIGYACGVDEMQEEAVAAGVAEYAVITTSIDQRNPQNRVQETEFRFLDF